MIPRRWASAVHNSRLLQTPRRLCNLLPPRRLSNSLPPRRLSNSLPPRRLSNSLPSRRLSNSLPSPQGQRVVLSRRVERAWSRAGHHAQLFTPPCSATKAVACAGTTTARRSAFPTKTVVCLALLGGLAYFLVEVREESWADDAQSAFRTAPEGAVPLHFYDTKDDLDHYLRFHVPDGSDTVKNPNAAATVSALFENMAHGWMMTEKEAREEKMPVTHGCRFQSNTLCEDYFALGTSPGVGEQPWNYWSVMDGHAGHYTAAYLQQVLVPRLSYALSSLTRTAGSLEIEETIRETFVRLDQQMMDSARTAAAWFPAANGSAMLALTKVFSGSCALLAALDPGKSTLRVACTGDSRAVLGRWDAGSEMYTCIPLSEDQTGFNADEVARLAAAHPDEPDMIDPHTGRLFGLAVTRAFGDHRWKWEADFVRTVASKFWGASPRPNTTTPPYLTAEPEVSETHVVRVSPAQAEATGRKSDFMILASDGLWDRMSSEHAVECVARWLEAKARGHGAVHRDPHLAAHPPTFGPTHLLDPGVEVVDGAVEWQATPEYFAIEDDNAAICLARNMLGGTRRNLFLGLLCLVPPFGRAAVDDATIMVVFFDELEDSSSSARTTLLPSTTGQDCTKKKWWMPW